jgi:aminotransferase
MAGFRVGYCVASEELTKKIALMFQTIFSCLPQFTQAGAVAAEENKEEIVQKRIVDLTEKRFLMVEGLRLAGIPCDYPDGAIYCFPDISADGITGDEFSNRLLKEYKVSVLPGSCFGAGLDNYIRLCFDTDIHTIIEGMKRICRFVETLKIG